MFDTLQRTACPFLVSIKISLSSATLSASQTDSVFIAVTPCPPRFLGEVSSTPSTLPPFGKKEENLVLIPKPLSPQISNNLESSTTSIFTTESLGLSRMPLTPRVARPWSLS